MYIALDKGVNVKNVTITNYHNINRHRIISSPNRQHMLSMRFYTCTTYNTYANDYQKKAKVTKTEFMWK